MAAESAAPASAPPLPQPATAVSAAITGHHIAACRRQSHRALQMLHAARVAEPVEEPPTSFAIASAARTGGDNLPGMVEPQGVTVESGVRYFDEDNGRSAIAEVTDGHVTVRIQEWHAQPGDNLLVPALAGERVRVTIEVLCDAVNTPNVPKSHGEFRFCRRCNMNQGVYSKQKFVGAARGGMKPQLRCLVCNLVLDGPRW